MIEMLPDGQWNNIYTTKPENGQKCMSKIKGEEGYVGKCVYKEGYFETHEDMRNRFVIIRWKHDLWLPL
jgi:hypothetical protein